MIKSYGQARALRDLGAPTDEQKKDYKINDAKTTLTVTFKSGARSFLIVARCTAAAIATSSINSPTTRT